MHRALCLAALLLAATPAFGQSDPAPAPPVALPGITCAQMAAEGGANPQLMRTAMAGLLAARANRPILSEAQIMASTPVVQAACAAPDGGAVSVLDILAAAPADPDLAAIDLTALTCASLAPVWRQKARLVVPFLAGWSSNPGGVVSRAQMERVANGVQTTCRNADNAERPILGIAAAAVQ